MEIYKLIFDKNNSDRIEAFLNDPFIKKLWPLFIAHSQESMYFSEQEESKQ